MTFKVSTIGVIGAGQMGAGISQVCAVAGYKVIMRDVKQEYVDRGLSVIKTSLSKLLEKGKITKEAFDTALANITPTLDIRSLRDCGLVIEAIPEDFVLKSETFKELDCVTKRDAILATNTSSISISKIAGVTKRPEKVIGIHFMNPVPIMQCVEIIRGDGTSDETYIFACSLVKALGKTAVTSKDSPGFIMNRVLIPMINEAVFALHEGTATAEDIDAGCRLSFNWPMGPLMLADLIGLDTVLSIQKVLHKEFGTEKYAPCALLEEYVKNGWLGRKSKRGFYVY